MLDREKKSTLLFYLFFAYVYRSSTKKTGDVSKIPINAKFQKKKIFNKNNKLSFIHLPKEISVKTFSSTLYNCREKNNNKPNLIDNLVMVVKEILRDYRVIHTMILIFFFFLMKENF